MDIVFGHIGEVEVYHLGQLLDVQTSGRDICGDQYPDFTTLELCEGPSARALTFVAVNGGGLNALLLQELCQFVSAVLGPREDQYLFPTVFFHKMRQQRGLLLFVYREQLLLYCVGGGIGHVDRYFNGVVEYFTGERTNLLGKRGREHQILSFCG